MKKTNKIYGLLFLSLITFSLLFTSCKKNFEEINDDPNNPKDVPNSFYLAGAERGIMDHTVDYWWGGMTGNQLGQYWSSNQYSSESRYQYRTQVNNDYFGYFYNGNINDGEYRVGGLMELKKIVDNCTTQPQLSSTSGDPNNQIAAATILRVWLMQNMTDTWGNIPYSEALSPEKTRAPKYDSQESIYAGLLSELNGALSKINTSAPGLVGDLIYGGNMTKWAKFGNSLKMRLALRMVDRNGGTAQTAFQDAEAAGAFTSNSDNALLPYGEGASQGNPIWWNYAVDGRNDYAASNIMMAILDSNTAMGHPLQDPRLPAFYAPNDDNGAWVGEVYGLTEANAAATPNSSISQRSELILSPTLPGIFMDYAQVEFMRAEALERGWTVSGLAEDHYKNGITASIKFWTTLNGAAAPQTDIDNYIAQDSVDYTKVKTAGGYKYAIGKQKWIALYNQGAQGWIEWKRLDFGILQLPADGVLEGTGIPLRMKYAVDEQTLNGANYSAAVSSQGPDLQETRLWWDVN